MLIVQLVYVQPDIVLQLHLIRGCWPFEPAMLVGCIYCKTPKCIASLDISAVRWGCIPLFSSRFLSLPSCNLTPWDYVLLFYLQNLHQYYCFNRLSQGRAHHRTTTYKKSFRSPSSRSLNMPKRRPRQSSLEREEPGSVPYLYRPLEPGFIRMLKILRGSNDASIYVAIEHQPLSKFE